MGAKSNNIMENSIYWIWLSILNFTPNQKNILYEIFKHPKIIFNSDESYLRKFTDSNDTIQKILDKEKKKQAEKIFYESEKRKIKCITVENNEYPLSLKNIYNRSLVLYAKGNIEKLKNKNKIAIVGSRKCSEYGKMITQRFSYLLAKKDFTIVSGMAKGIDSYAHMGTILAKGTTIAVLGSGIEYIYPEENKKLYNKILDTAGIIISEYPLYTKPVPENFPMRNRIISGISDKVLITEAGIKSGSIITANLAVEQGKDVYAIPGNITYKQSEGTNQLIKDGAFLVTRLEDIANI